MKSKALARITSSQLAFQSSVDWQTVEIFIVITERRLLCITICLAWHSYLPDNMFVDSVKPNESKHSILS